ncbi:hypothetical protein BD770DRAFT_398127 [Pilaira anomala]|nr:hypothetical protein BD770DRAFT_398127 [Pilaira anomala]
MAYNNNNKRFKRQEQDDNNLPQVFQRLGNISRPYNNNHNNNNKRTQRYDGAGGGGTGLRIARYNSTQRAFPDYGKISQLADEAIYYSPNNNNNYTFSPPSITNPTTTKSDFRFVRNDSQKDISRPIISFLRDTPTSNGQISPLTQPSAHNNNDIISSNNNNPNFNHYNVHPINNRRVINTEERHHHYHHHQQQNEEEVEEEEEELDERTSYNNRINIEIAKKIQITASIPPSTDNNNNNNNSDTNNEMSSSNLDNPILTSKRKVTLTSSEKNLNSSHHEKRSRSNSSSNRSTTRRSSPSRSTRRSRSRSPRTKRNRSPSPSPSRRRPRRSSEPSYDDSDDEVPFLNLKGDTYVPRYADDHDKHINHRLTGSKKFKELRSFPPLSQLPPTKDSHHKTWVKSTPPAAIENNYPLPPSKKFTGVTNTTVNVTPNNTRNHSMHNNSSVNTAQKPIDLTQPTTSITNIPTQSVNTSITTTANTNTTTTTTTAAVTSTKPDNTAITTPAINTSVKPALTSVKPTSKTQPNLSTINTPVHTASNLLTDHTRVKPVSKQKIIHNNNNNSPTQEEKSPSSIDTTTTTIIPAQPDKIIQFGLKEKVVGSNMNDTTTTSLESNNNGLHVNDIRHDENQDNINNKHTTIQLVSDTSVHQESTTVKKGIENQGNHSTVIKNTATPIPSGSQQDTIRIASNHDKTSTTDPAPMNNHSSTTTITTNTTQNVLSKKGEKAKELLRQLAIDERDDIVMDIVPLVRNTDGITSPSVLKNHFHNLCKRSDIPILKQETLPDTTTIPEQQQQQDPVDTNHGLVQAMSSLPIAAESLSPEKNKMSTKLPEIDTQKAVLNSPPPPLPPSLTHQLISPPVSSTTETPPISLPTIKPRIKTTQKTGRLPPPWKARMSDSGDIYYLNTVTGEKTSTRPV